MANADFFTCAIIGCGRVVEVQNGRQDVAVIYDPWNKPEGWRVICDSCQLKLAEQNFPHMVINYERLKEVPCKKIV